VGLLNCCKLLAASMCPFLLAMPAISQNRPTVMTQQGKVEGKMSPDGRVREFLGIPYAVPPLGPLRWKPPQPGLKWRRVRSTTSFGAHCMQPAIYADMVFRDPGQSEDCLTLNVWTPAKDKVANLPVMVWIHGGGLPGGSSEPRQDGENLAHKGVLVVSMNYRLGIFGFFALPALAMESPRHAAGNYGLMDQIAALQWVHRNIAAFGGDPEKVTLFGESFGAISASILLASPLSKGLFARAIGESGGAFTNYRPTPQIVAQRQDQDFAQAAFGNSNVARH
jgi:para-nitrobenzyl esterase